MNLKDEEVRGRTTGSFAWRLARGELGQQSETVCSDHRRVAAVSAMAEPINERTCIMLRHRLAPALRAPPVWPREH